MYMYQKDNAILLSGRPGVRIAPGTPAKTAESHLILASGCFLFIILFHTPHRRLQLSKMRRHLFPVQRIGDRGRCDLRDPKSMPDALRAAQAAEEEGSRDDEQRVAQQ